MRFFGGHNDPLKRITLLLLLILALSMASLAQTSSIFWMTYIDTSYSEGWTWVDQESYLFGNDVLATDSVDSALGEFVVGGDLLPFSSFWWLPKYEESIWNKDLRGVRNTTQRDTFYLELWNIFDSCAYGILRWPPASYLQQRTDSMYIIDPTYTIITHPINMFSVDSVVLQHPYRGGPNPFQTNLQLQIFKYGIHIPLVDNVNQNATSDPKSFSLSQNYPNPFNPSTTIHFDLPKESNVILKVYNLLGQEMMTLVDGKRTAGGYDVRVDGSKLSSGVYFYHIVAGYFVQTKKMVVLR